MRNRSDLVLTAGALVVLVGTFAPWVRTGERQRSSYRLLGLIDRLGFTPDGVAALAVRWWPLVPLLATATTIAAWWPLRRASAGLGTLTAVYVTGVAIAVGRAPVPTLVGRSLVLCGAAVLIAGAIWATIPDRHQRHATGIHAA